jgi:hypothetical protein
MVTITPHENDLSEETPVSVDISKRSHTILSRVPRMAIGGFHAVKMVVGRTATTLAPSLLTLQQPLSLLDEPGQLVYSKNVKQLATVGRTAA